MICEDALVNVVNVARAFCKGLYEYVESNNGEKAADQAVKEIWKELGVNYTDEKWEYKDEKWEYKKN